jgi:hypothetical protein
MRRRGRRSESGRGGGGSGLCIFWREVKKKKRRFDMVVGSEEATGGDFSELWCVVLGFVWVSTHHATHAVSGREKHVTYRW